MAPPLVEIVPIGPISCGACGFSQRGRLHVTLVVKATFALVHAGTAELVDPEAIATSEIHNRNNPARSIRAASDLAPYLRRGEVLFSGHACAPGGRAAPRVSVRLAVLREARTLVDKKLVVEGDDSPSGPKPFERMPLVYERAYGGPGWVENPLGVGSSAGSARPNIVDPRDLKKSIGLGPISRPWPARRRLIASADRKAIDQLVAELPDNFDWNYFQAAPPDQQCEFFQGDERIVLEGVHPTLPRFETRLPGARATARVFGLPGTQGPRPVAFQLDTLSIDGDAERCSAVWRAAIPVPDRGAIAGLSVLAALEMPGQAIDWPASPSAARGSQRPPAPSHPDQPKVAGGGTLDLDGDARPAFDQTLALDVGESKEPPAARGRPAENPLGSTIALSPDQEAWAANRPASPFAAPPAASRKRTPAPIPGAPWGGRASPVALPLASIAQTLDDAELRDAVAEFEPELAAKRSPAARATPTFRDPAEIDLAECAAIAAELALGKPPRAEVLGAHGLDDAAWRRAEKRHTDAMDRDVDAGERSMRHVYDTAFIEAVERVRGAITPEDHAKLLFAAERGEIAKVLDALGLTRAAWLRAQRILKRRSVQEAAYGAATERALAALRKG